MADYRFSVSVIGRSAGRSSVACAAYRHAQRMEDDRTGLAHDFTRKGGVAHSEIMTPKNTPNWMRDRSRLWNGIEAIERRKDAQLSREVQLSLPHELSDEQRRELVRGFVQEAFVDRGMIADLAIHAPGKDGDDRNHHAHVMLSTREIAGEGFGKKVRAWNAPELLENWREQWATHQNREFERHGLEVRVDHRSFLRRGIDRESGQHLGPTAHKMEKRGDQSRIGDENRALQDRNAQRRDRERSAKVIDLEIERERRQPARLQTEQARARQEMAEKHAADQAALAVRLEQSHRPKRETLAQETARLDENLRRRGFGKFLRDVTGQTRRDTEARALRQAELERMAQIEQQARTAQVRQQEQQRTVLAAYHRLQAEQMTRKSEAAKSFRTATERQEGHLGEGARQALNHSPAALEERRDVSQARRIWDKAGESNDNSRPAADDREARARQLREAFKKKRGSQSRTQGRGRGGPSMDR